MNIGELFVSLGIKGGKQTTDTLQATKGGMRDIKKMSIEAKAAILATVFGLQRLTSQSMQNGTELVRFSNLTGQSTKKLQQWQYANKMAGGSAEEVTGTVEGMLKAFAQLQLGEGPAKYLGLFAEGLQKVGESLDPEKMKDAFYTLEKARAFLRGGGTGNIGVDNEIISSLGINPGMIAGLRGGQFDDKILNQARTYTDGQAKELARLKGMWTNLSDFIDKEVGKLNAKFGPQLVKDISMITKEMSGLVSQMVEFANKVGAFQILGDALKNIANGINLVNGFIGGNDDGFSNDLEIQRRALSKAGLADGTNDSIAGNRAAVSGFIGSIIDWIRKTPSGDVNGLLNGSAYARPNMGGAAISSTSSSKAGLTVQQTFNLQPGDLASGVRSAARDGVKSAYQQLQQGAQ